MSFVETYKILTVERIRHMDSRFVIVAETGSDTPKNIADKYGIYLVPMHVSMGTETLDDGTFPPEDICAYYDRTGSVPKTSASTPSDFEAVFDKIHEKYPDKHILHLAYSAITTCSYQSALIAAENRDYVTSIDTKHVSVGQAAVVIETVKTLAEHPEYTIDDAVDAVNSIAGRIHMCFLPKNLDYLRAGGRVSNVVALTGNLLGLHPCIEIIDGKLMAKKKYRGALKKVTPNLIEDFAKKYSISKDRLYFIWSPGLDDEVRVVAEDAAEKLGFKRTEWFKTGCVITCHGGPGCIGIVGFSDK